MADTVVEMEIREATRIDWAGIWPIFEQIVRAGETYMYPPDLTEYDAEETWMQPPPGIVFVALGKDGAVLGSARVQPNHPGQGAHVANASFIVDPGAGGRGVGRALAVHAVEWAGGNGYRAMQFNAVVETNERAVALWQSLGFEIKATIPEAFDHPDRGLVGIYIMHRTLG